jgi:hypothetical protein
MISAAATLDTARPYLNTGDGARSAAVSTLDIPRPPGLYAEFAGHKQLGHPE